MSGTSIALVAGCGVAGLVTGVILGVRIVPGLDGEHVGSWSRVDPVAAVRTGRGRLLALTTGALFAALAARFDDTWVLPAYLVLGAGLVTLSVIDLEHHLLPNRIVYPLGAITVSLLGVAAAAEGTAEPFGRALACGVGALVAFVLLHAIAPHALGFGDVRLAAVLGAALGWLGVRETVLGFALGFVEAAVVGVVLMIIGRADRRTALAFGVFLAAGALTVIFAGDAFLD